VYVHNAGAAYAPGSPRFPANNPTSSKTLAVMTTTTIK
jgi:hypothetical protein